MLWIEFSWNSISVCQKNTSACIAYFADIITSAKGTTIILFVQWFYSWSAIQWMHRGTLDHLRLFTTWHLAWLHILLIRTIKRQWTPIRSYQAAATVNQDVRRAWMDAQECGTNAHHRCTDDIYCTSCKISHFWRHAQSRSAKNYLQLQFLQSKCICEI